MKLSTHEHETGEIKIAFDTEGRDKPHEILKVIDENASEKEVEELLNRFNNYEPLRRCAETMLEAWFEEGTVDHSKMRTAIDWAEIGLPDEVVESLEQ